MAVSTAAPWIDAPLVYKGKVRELYDLGEHYLIVVTDRISAFDYILEPPVPEKGNVLNQLSAFWFEKTRHLIENHVVHTDVYRLGSIVKEPELLKHRIMVTRKAERIDIECVVRGYITGAAGVSIHRLARLTVFRCRRDFARMSASRSHSSRQLPRMM